jgi:N-acetylmuramoyl-L-alanine amidase
VVCGLCLFILTAAATHPLAAAGPRAGSAAVALVDARIANHGDDGTQLTLALTHTVDYRLWTAPGARRVVIALPSVHVRVPDVALAVPKGLITRVRASDAETHGARLIVDLSAPARLGDVYFMKAGDHKYYQLVLNLLPRQPLPPVADTGQAVPPSSPLPVPPEERPAPRPDGGSKLAETGATAPLASLITASVAGTGGAAPRLPTIVPAPRPRPSPAASPPTFRPVIVIDPGHGGKDPGTIGPQGEFEKDITLAYAREIRRALLTKGDYKVILTRNRDVFIPLRQRVEKARKADADMFVSIHANTMSNPETSGLSVFTLSEHASDVEAAALADKENGVDRLGGINLANTRPEVAGILIDVLQRQTMNRSVELASLILDEMRRTTPVLPIKPHRFAGFAVLKAADVPSVLIELGFLSNPADEKRLRNSEHRKRIADGIAAAIDRYFDRVQVARAP